MRSKLLNEIASTMKIIIILIKIYIKRSCNASNETLTSKHSDGFGFYSDIRLSYFFTFQRYIYLREINVTLNSSMRYLRLIVKATFLFFVLFMRLSQIFTIPAFLFPETILTILPLIAFIEVSLKMQFEIVIFLLPPGVTRLNAP